MRTANYLRLLVFLGLLPCLLAAQSSPFDLSRYRAQDGLTAAVDVEGQLVVDWRGDAQEHYRVTFAIVTGTPTIRALAVSDDGGRSYRTLARELTPEYRIVTGRRRLTQQQLDPLVNVLGKTVTDSLIDRYQWDAFWDAPLYTSDEPPLSHVSSIPAAEPMGSQPGLPRDTSEIERVTATYRGDSGRVTMNGNRLEIVFPGVEAGLFRGSLRYDIFRGSGLVRQLLLVTTDAPSVAFKYAGGLSGLPAGPESRVVWNDLTGRPQEYRLGGEPQEQPVVLKTNNRLLAADLGGGALAAFPAPHSFYWARESEQNLGYGWYRKDDEGHFSFGIRQAEGEQDPEFYHNFALYNARPGTEQRLPVFFYLTAGPADTALARALRLTNGDRFRRLPGHRVMGHHYHVGLVRRLQEAGGYGQRLNDIGTMQGVGIDIFSVIDGARGPGRKDTGELYLNDLHQYYAAARAQSDAGFLLMPSDENSTGGRRPFLGGHYELLPSHPIYWRPARAPGQPLAEEHPEYGTVYNLGEPNDLMEMCERENVIVSMAHPDAKRSTGYPYAIWDEDYFQHPRFFGLGWRWGMGIDASEVRLGEYRFQRLWDETNNYLSARDLPLKQPLAISEARSDLGDRGKPPWDDTYGMSPVNYLRIDSVPGVDDMSSIVEALRTGEYFVTSGEVLLPECRLEGEGEQRTMVATVEWTFPLDFVELVWGDGISIERELVSATETGTYGRREFRIPFAVGEKRWVRFAAWDVAGNGAMGVAMKP